MPEMGLLLRLINARNPPSFQTSHDVLLKFGLEAKSGMEVSYSSGPASCVNLMPTQDASYDTMFMRHEIVEDLLVSSTFASDSDTF